MHYIFKPINEDQALKIELLANAIDCEYKLVREDELAIANTLVERRRHIIPSSKGYEVQGMPWLNHESLLKLRKMAKSATNKQEIKPVIPNNTLFWVWHDEHPSAASLRLLRGENRDGNFLFSGSFSESDLYQYKNYAIAEFNEDGTVKPFEGVDHEA